VCSTDVGHFSKTAASDLTKAARAKFESRRNRLSQSTEALPSSAAEASASDIQSRRSSLQSRLFRSARQASRSAQQSDAGQESQQETSAGHRRRLKRRSLSHQPAVSNVADEQSVSSDTSQTTADSQSTGSSATRRPAQSHDTGSSPSAAHGLNEMSQEPHRSQAITQDETGSRLADSRGAVPVTRCYRAPAVTRPMSFSSTTGRNVQISDDCRTACRQPGDFCNAYVFTQQPLLPGEELVLRITGMNMDYAGGLTVGLTACDPTKLKVTDLPDDADKLLDRPEYWVVHKNICSHPKVNDELAFLRTISGKFLVCTS